MKRLLALPLLLCCLAHAKDEPLPTAITSAKTVAIIARLGTIGPGGYTPDVRRAKKQVREIIEKWGRYTVVDDASKADLVLVITEGHSGSIVLAQSAGNETYRTGTAQEASILADILAVYKGGATPDPNAEPLWIQIERGGYTWPAKRAANKFRKDVEAAEKPKR